MSKIINLKSSEEITDVVEYLWETGANEVYFLAPKGAPFLKNTVALKLLKREADRLDKTVVLITKDEVVREMAKRVGLSARVSLPKGVEDLEYAKSGEKTKEEDEEVFKELSPQKYESLLEEQVKLKRDADGRAPAYDMSDIKPSAGKASKIDISEEREAEEAEEKDEFQEADFKEESRPSFFKRLIDKGEEDLKDEDKGEDDLDSYLVSDDDDFKKTKPFYKERKRRGLDFGEKRSAPDQESRSSSPFFSFKFLSFFVGGALIVAAAVLYFILPKAEIVINPKIEPIVQDLSVSAEKNIVKSDVVLGKIPAQLIRLDKKASKDFPATGERQLNDKATGTITIYNEFSSTPQTLVEKTRFVSSDGKVFRITKTIVVPGAKIEEGKIIASSIDAQVQADQAGEEYNIGPSDFKIPGFQGSPKYNAFYAKSKTAMTGGAVGLAKVISQNDFDKAKADLWQSLQPAIKQEIKSQVSPELKLLEGAAKEEVSSFEAIGSVGDKAESFNLSIKGTATVLVFDENDIFSLAAKKVNEKLADNKILDEGANAVEYSDLQSDFNKGQLAFKVKITQRLVWKVDADNISRLIAGKNESQIKAALGQKEEVEKARILFWPFWVKSVPVNLDKIKIRVIIDPV
ncbi:baseplate J/gp47 family protein [Patescibacteria group bacterium]|nr:baseplate J/gp47 family protein [Patescibacteria group bacterium]